LIGKMSAFIVLLIGKMSAAGLARSHAA